MKQHSTKSLLALDQIMTDTMREAAQEASIADGVLVAGNHSHQTMNEQNKIKKTDLRRGKWTLEEETYANRLIEEFKAGMLPIADGTTLRTFLSKLLNCDPMRISKKYVGNNCIGKQVYRQRHGDIEDIPPERIERSRKELEELERQFVERSKQSSGRNRSSKHESGHGGRGEGGGMKAPRLKKENDHDGYTQFKPNSSSSSNGPVAPWIIPSNFSSYGSESNNPYSSSDHSRNNNNNNTSNNERLNGYGITERATSELDLYNLPDAFASTSSLDLLGTIAEMKLPSARSLENIQKLGMDNYAGSASQASLSEWYTILGENAPLSSTSMCDLPSQNASTTSLASNYNTSMDWSINPLMPWDTKKSASDSLSSDPQAHPQSQAQSLAINTSSANGSINEFHSPTNTNNNTTPKNLINNPILKHSLSRELLQAAAAASAHDEAKHEIAKILKQQKLEKSKEMTLNNNLNTSLNINSSESNSKTSLTSPRASTGLQSPYDNRRSASVNNFMMLVEMGDIPRPDSSILLKNIFSDAAMSAKQVNPNEQDNTTNSSSSSSTSSNSSFPIPTTKRTLEPTQCQQQQHDNNNNNEDNESTTENKRRRFSTTSSTSNSDGNQNDEEDEDDCLGDEQIISAAVVRRPFT